MKLKFLPLIALAWTCATQNVMAQKADISPVPQEITWGEKAFDKGFAYTLTGEADADVQAIKALKSKITSGQGSSVSIVIGEKGDAAVKEYEANIPNKKEGYYLKVEPGKVVIAGNDGSGTFYGVQTFLQIAAQEQIMQAEVKDYPEVLDRGVVEGFYGNPWSTADRKRQFEFYAANKMNVYIYGPKDDPYHRAKWRQPYPEAEAKVLKELIESAHDNKVQFVWALHPGNDIKWNDTDRQNVIKKLELMYDMGVRAFSLFFDDIGGEGTDANKQAELINYVNENFIKRHEGVPPIIFCPTQYNRGWASGDYLNILGTKSEKGARIMWTGNSVVDMINKEDMDWINKQIKRNAYIWLNYPTTDYCIDRMLMGPTYGNDKNIADQLSGFVANPSEYAEASKISLFSIADYTWNMDVYDENASWERGMKYLMPEHTKAFKVFCENNIDLGNTTHGLRRANESKRFAEAIATFKKAIENGMNSAAFDAIKPMFDEFVTSCDELLAANLAEDPLVKELTPWLKVMKLMGQRGQNMCKLYATLEQDKPEEFINLFKEMIAFETEQKNIRSRDFEGSIKSPNPTVAAEVVAPFLKEYTNHLIAEYKKLYKDGWENFPAVVLNDGKFYIMYQDKYLTNVNGSKNPTFVSKKDDINPQRQEWMITMDYTTNRFKIVNAQDQKYINELGNFGENKYDATWNTYVITRMNGKYAIQNAGHSGNKYWTVSNSRVNQSGSNAYQTDHYKFDLINLNEEAVAHPSIDIEKKFYIINSKDGKYLTNKGGNRPTFETKIKNDTQKSQSWTFSIPAGVKRYKIVSTKDKRYINELGVFGTNQYDDAWNTYGITEMGGVFSIQNAGKAGSDFWTIVDNKIEKANIPSAESYTFTIEEIGGSATGIDEVVAEEPAKDNKIYDLSGRLVTQPQKGIYIQNGNKLVVRN